MAFSILKLFCFLQFKDKWLPCKYCDQYFPTTNLMSIHEKQKHKSVSRRIPCDICPVTCFNQNALTVHVNTLHKDLVEKSWKICQMCQNYFPGKYPITVTIGILNTPNLTLWTLFGQVFKWSDHMIRRTIQIPDILDLKQTFFVGFSDPCSKTGPFDNQTCLDI